MNALDSYKNEIYKFLVCDQADKIDVKRRVMERVKKEIIKRLDDKTGLNLNGQKLIKAINCRVIYVAVYEINVCNQGKGDLDELKIYWKVYCGEKDFMGNNQSMKHYIQRETKVVEDSKVSKSFIMKQKLEWHATWLQQQRNG